jgi:hypothetical protein
MRLHTRLPFLNLASFGFGGLGSVIGQSVLGDERLRNRFSKVPAYSSLGVSTEAKIKQDRRIIETIF